MEGTTLSLKRIRNLQQEWKLLYFSFQASQIFFRDVEREREEYGVYDKDKKKEGKPDEAPAEQAPPPAAEAPPPEPEPSGPAPPPEEWIPFIKMAKFGVPRQAVTNKISFALKIDGTSVIDAIWFHAGKGPPPAAAPPPEAPPPPAPPGPPVNTGAQAPEQQALLALPAPEQT